MYVCTLYVLRRLGILDVSQTRQLVYNLSSKNLDSDTTKFLELGPKFVFPENKFETLNLNSISTLSFDKVEIENLVHNISNVNNIKNEKLPKIITEIRTVSENYF